MPFSDYGIGWAQTNIDTAIHRYETRIAKAGFTRMGMTTASWFTPPVLRVEGKRMFYRMWKAPMTATRISDFDTAMTTEFPIGQNMEVDEFSLTQSDLSAFRSTAKWNMEREWKHDGTEKGAHLAMFNLVSKIFEELETDQECRYNMALFQENTSYMAKVHTFYNQAGTSSGDTATGYTGHGAMFIRIKDGSIARFVPGMVLDIYDADTTTQKNITCVVHDVIQTPDGPPVSGARQAGIGPGLVCEPCAADGSTSAGTGYDTVWNAVGVPASGDYIAMSGEFSTASPKGFHGIPDWFDSTVDCWRDADGNAVNRETAGNGYLNPMVFTPSGATAGSPVALDIDTHFRAIENSLGYKVRLAQGRAVRAIGQGMRTGPNNELAISKRSLTLITTPEIENDVVDEARDTIRFTSTAAMSQDTVKELVGQVGFTGFFYNSPTLGHVAMVADPNCKPYHAFCIDPESFHRLDGGTAGKGLKWVMNAGSRLHPVYGDTNKTPTYYQQVACYRYAALLCDQPGVNFCLRYITVNS